MTHDTRQAMPRSPLISVIGLASWDHILQVDQYPSSGSYAIIHDHLELPGGTAANAAATIATLGGRAILHTSVGDDRIGIELRDRFEAMGIELHASITSNTATDRCFIVVESQSAERTIFWEKGARPALGDRLAIDALYDADLVLLDVDDSRLRRFLVDLPVHTYPAARLLGTLNYVDNASDAELWDDLLRCDLLVGNERDLMEITGASSLTEAAKCLQSRMRGSNLRGSAITKGRQGAIGMTMTEMWDAPGFSIEAVDTTGAGDAFAGGFAFAMALRWAWPEALRFANAVAALSTRALGAQSALATYEEALSLIEAQPLTQALPMRD